jgi:acetate kinase
MTPVLIVLNAGSSSLKFQVFDVLDGAEPRLVWKGLYEGLGETAHFLVKDTGGSVLDEMTWSSDDRFGHEEALMHLVSWLSQFREERKPVAIGHRVVHGGAAFSSPVLVDESVLQSLEALVPLAPLHQPHNLEPIRIVRRRLPGMPQVACFDTAFHQSQSDIATLFALPREMRERGVRRYGFHGLSYDYIASVLKHYDPRLAEGRVIVAHLGNGASLCALQGGVSIATTMGFSALDGLPMGTRCGAIDAGVVFFMLREMKLSPEAAERMLYTKSGFLGVSGLSNDMRVLRANAAENADSRRAIDLFVYRILREIGSLVAALGGIDGLIFTAGIGENDAATRAEVASGLAWAGLTLDERANSTGGPRISTGSGPEVWVIPTNEELVIARQTRSALVAAQTRLAS